MATRAAQGPRKVYRFAVYGVRASGKTCILAALSMWRTENPRGFTCSWIEEDPGNPLPNGDPSAWDTDDPFHLGWRWLKAQKKLLESGEVPHANANRDLPTSYIFDFSAPERGRFRVELIDYSGELITATSSELAARLRDHMRTCDGVLLLAETPRPGHHLAPLAEDFEKLKGAFSVLLDEREHSSRQEWPVAVLLNKWDRHGPIAFDRPDEEHQRLDEFLESQAELPHRGLCLLARNVVAEECSRVFPVSAFGAHEFVDGKERPKLLNKKQLHSFGLEDPFVWLAELRDRLDAEHQQRQDELDMEQYEAAVAGCSQWAFWQAVIGRSLTSPTGTEGGLLGWAWNGFRGLSPFRLWRAGHQLRKRIPGSLELKQSVRQARRKSMVQGVACAIMCLLALLTVEFLVFDRNRPRAVLANVANPTRSADEAESDETWLASYAKSSKYRHVLSKWLVLSPDKARSLLDQSRTARETSIWENVSQATDPKTKFEFAQKYRNAFPNGEHVTEVNGIVAEENQSRHERANLDALHAVESKLKAIGNENPEASKKIQTLREEIASLPHPDAISETVVQEQNALRERLDKALELANAEVQKRHERAALDTLRAIEDDLKAIGNDNPEAGKSARALRTKFDGLSSAGPGSAKIAEARKALADKFSKKSEAIYDAQEETNWRTFVETLDDLLRGEQLVEAAKHLAAWNQNDPRLGKFVDRYRERCGTIVSKQVREKIRSRNWDSARNALQPLRDALVVQFLDAEQVRSLNALGKKVDEAEDRDLYDQIQRNRPRCRDEIDHYLRSAPLKSMAGDVEKYKDYLDQMARPIDLKLVLSQIDWGEGVDNDYEYHVQIIIDGECLIEDPKLLAKKNTRTGKVGKPAEIRKSIDDEIKLSVKIVHKAWWYLTSDYEVGTTVDRGTVKELENGKTLEVGKDGQKSKIKVSLKVTGFPEEPSLPTWSARR